MSDLPGSTGGGWRTADSAPKDGTLVDVWVTESFLPRGATEWQHRAYRMCDVHWGKFWVDYDRDKQPLGVGWCCEGDHYGEPYQRGLEVSDPDEVVTVTHWMFAPEPPK